MKIVSTPPFSLIPDYFINFVNLQDQICKIYYLKKFPEFFLKLSEFKKWYLYVRFFEHNKWIIGNFFNYINILLKKQRKNLTLIIYLLSRYDNFYQIKQNKNIKKISNCILKNPLICILVN